MNQVPQTPLVRFYKTPSMRCPYLTDQDEQLIFTHLKGPKADGLHNVLAQAGFRRSHNILYRPDCPSCNACVPVRVPAHDFVPSRSQKRVRSMNQTIRGAIREPIATVAQYDLFTRYQDSRHGDGSMAKMGFDDYQAMVEDTPVRTFVIEYTDAKGDLVACALSDRLGDGLSMVYSFFEPALGRRSLGTYVILDHIERAPGLGLPYVYLGYWIGACEKMAYKERFSPLEALRPGGWEPFAP